ncbi:hypothetical protein [Thermomonas sp. HDW16]|uniref:hypothetical protein n=1 Tax=Thermomonas sp. HDW16 TaxID=2714945 RepID=UPI00140B073C|nr:hypothetical protein [Thermomonas sp. HDW16]QIL20889.1 hypothetical protein G7079_09150 [Thermomonas sp. HDW16]
MQAIAPLRTEPADADIASDQAVRFVTPEGTSMSSNHPGTKAMLASLGRMFPVPSAVMGLVDTDPDEMESGRQATAESPIEPLETIVRGFRFGIIDLLVDPPDFAPEAGEKPLFYPLARMQVDSGATTVASMRPSMVSLDSPLTRELLLLLDGSRDHETIQALLAERMHALGTPEGLPARDLEWWRANIVEQLATGLQQAAKLGVLVEN